MAKVHIGVNLILAAPRRAFQTQSVSSVRLSAQRDMINKAAIQMYGAGADFTFLWLGVMTVKMGALGGVLICLCC